MPYKKSLNILLSNARLYYPLPHPFSPHPIPASFLLHCPLRLYITITNVCMCSHPTVTFLLSSWQTSQQHCTSLSSGRASLFGPKLLHSAGFYLCPGCYSFAGSFLLWVPNIEKPQHLELGLHFFIYTNGFQCRTHLPQEEGSLIFRRSNSRMNY